MADKNIILPKGFTLTEDEPKEKIVLPEGFTLTEDEVKKKEPTPTPALAGELSSKEFETITKEVFDLGLGVEEEPERVTEPAPLAPITEFPEVTPAEIATTAVRAPVIVPPELEETYTPEQLQYFEKQFGLKEKIPEEEKAEVIKEKPIEEKMPAENYRLATEKEFEEAVTTGEIEVEKEPLFPGTNVPIRQFDVTGMSGVGPYKIETPLDYIFMAGYNQSLVGLTDQIINKEARFNIGDYDPSVLEDIGAIAFGFFIDAPFFVFTGGAGGLATKTALTASARIMVKQAAKQSVKALIKKGASRELAERAVKIGMKKNVERIGKFIDYSQRAGSSGAALGSYGATHEAMRQMTEDERSFSEIDWGEVRKEGFISGSLGLILGGIGVGGKIVEDITKKSITKGFGRTAALGGIKVGEVGAEVGIFTAAPLLKGEPITRDDFFNAMKMVAGAKISGLAQKGLFKKDYKFIKAEDFKFNEGKFRSEFTEEELRRINKGKTSEETLKRLRDNEDELREVLEDENIPLMAKYNLLWSIKGVRPNKTEQITDISIETVEDKTLVTVKNEEGVLLEVKEYASKQQAERDAMTLIEKVKDQTQKQRTESLNINDKQQLREDLKAEGVDLKKIDDALDTEPAFRTAEQKKSINDFNERVDELLKKEEKKVPEAPEVPVEEAKPLKVEEGKVEEVTEKPPVVEKAEVVEELPGKEVPPEIEVEKPITETTFKAELKEKFVEGATIEKPITIKEETPERTLTYDYYTETTPEGEVKYLKKITGIEEKEIPIKLVGELAGIKKALVPEAKIEEVEIEKRTPEQMLERGKKMVDQGEINPQSITGEIAGGKPRALQPDEVASLVYYKAKLDKEFDNAYEKINEAIKNKNFTEEQSQRAKLTQLERQLDDYHIMSLKTAYEQSLAFRLRKMLLDNEYNLQAQISKYKVANKGVIPAEIEAKFREYDKKLKEANEKLEETEKKLVTAENEIEGIQGEIQREKRISKEKRIKEVAKKIATKIRKGKIHRPDVFAAATPGSIAWDGALEVAAKTIETGGTIAQAVVDGIRYIKASDWYKSLAKEKQEEAESAYKDFLSEKEETTPGDLKIPTSIIKDFVERGIDNIGDLTKAVHEEIKGKFPEVTERKVRDAITGYGKIVNMSREDIDIQIRKMRRMGRLISGIEDVKNKKRPLRSGLQRDKLDAEERAKQKELKELMKDLPVEEVELEKQWKSTLEGIKTRLKNSIEDLQRRIETGEKPPPKRIVKYDLETKELKAERDRLKKVVEEIEGKPEITDEQKVKLAIRGEERRIAEYERRIREKELETPERKPIPQTPELKALKIQKERLKDELQKLQAEAGIPEMKRLEQTKKRTQKTIDDLQKRIRTKNFAPKPKREPIKMDEELTKLKAEKDKIKEQYDLEHEKLRLVQRPIAQKIWDTAWDLVMNLPKTMRATMDMSAPFRQGVVFVMRPSKWKTTAGAFKTMFKHSFSEKKADDWLRYIKASPEYSLMKSSGLFLAEPTAKLSAREEVYRSNLADKIPIYKYLHKASQRAYIGFLNKMRVDAFLGFSDRMIKEGHNPQKEPEIFKAWADYVNNATGRGNMGKFEQAAEILNNFFFSPRLIAARFNLLNPIKYAKMPPKVRKEALLSTFEFIGTGMAVLMMGAMAGADVELDPRSSDFGKWRIGTVRIDIWGGFVQWVRLFAQLASGQRKSTRTGEIQILGERYGSQSRSDVLVNFFKYKLSPTTATALSLAEGKNPIGQDVDAIDELTNLAIPLYLDDVDDLLKEEKLGVLGTAGLVGAAFFGIGVMQYDTETKRKEEKKVISEEIPAEGRIVKGKVIKGKIVR